MTRRKAQPVSTTTLERETVALRDRISLPRAARMCGPEWQDQPDQLADLIAARGGPDPLPVRNPYPVWAKADLRAWLIEQGIIRLITVKEAAVMVSRTVAEVEEWLGETPERVHDGPRERVPLPVLAPESTGRRRLVDEATFREWAVRKRGWILPDGTPLVDYDDIAKLTGTTSTWIKTLSCMRDQHVREGRAFPLPAPVWTRGQRPGTAPLFRRDEILAWAPRSGRMPGREPMP